MIGCRIARLLSLVRCVSLDTLGSVLSCSCQSSHPGWSVLFTCLESVGAPYVLPHQVVTTFTWFSRFPFPLPFNMYPLTWFAGLISLVHPRVWTFLLSHRPTSPLASYLPSQLLLVAHLPPFPTSHPDDFTLESFTLLWSIFLFF